MNDKLRQAAEMALEALEWRFSNADEAIEALRQALAEPDMGIDRGAWLDVPDATKWVDELRGDEPQRDWVRLTNEEIDHIWGITPPDYVDKFALPRMIEAKLKEKNA